jgi:hypothetical protein
MGFYRGPQIVRDGLVLALDAGSPNSHSGSPTSYYWRDLSPTGTQLILVNGAAYNASNQGVIYFDTADDYAVTDANSAYAFGTRDFTIEAWVKPTQLSNQYHHILALPQQDTFALKAEINTGNIYFYSPSFTTSGSTSGWTLTENAWNHVVLTRASSTAYAYLNGVSKGSKAGFTNNFTSQILNIHNGWPGEFTEMYFGPVRIYNIGLTSDQVLQNYNAQRSRFNL